MLITTNRIILDRKMWGNDVIPRGNYEYKMGIRNNEILGIVGIERQYNNNSYARGTEN